MGRFYTDTPGISDVEIKERAINELNATLSKGGKIAIVFVITLESGRIRGGDVESLVPVMKALGELKYALIINKLELDVIDILEKDNNQLKLLKERIKKSFGGRKFTLFLNQYNSGLASSPNKLWMTPDLKNFINSLPINNVDQKQVKIDLTHGVSDLQDEVDKVKEQNIENKIKNDKLKLQQRKLELKPDYCTIPHCTNPNGGNLFCNFHSCNSCGKFQRVQPYRLCQLHRCEEAHCNEEKRDGKFCYSHSCQHSDCYNKVKDMGKYCNNHACNVTGCDMEKEHGSYCYDHTCLKGGCNQKAPYRSYCSSHRCSRSGCLNEKYDGKSYCYDHSSPDGISTCYKCELAATRYCYFHQCDCCDDGKEDNSQFCQSHKCEVCTRAAYGDKFCRQHRCLVDGCNNQKEEYSNYCYDHKCSSCNNPTAGYSTHYCVQHACWTNDCSNEKVDPSNYCYKHKCLSCNESKYRNGYCIDHGCFNCGKEIVKDIYCGKHRPAKH